MCEREGRREGRRTEGEREREGEREGMARGRELVVAHLLQGLCLPPIPYQFKNMYFAAT